MSLPRWIAVLCVSALPLCAAPAVDAHGSYAVVVSRATAKAHVSHILDKLGVSNRAEAVVLAVRQQLVD